MFDDMQALFENIGLIMNIFLLFFWWLYFFLYLCKQKLLCNS